jgi:hypothetical protein
MTRAAFLLSTASQPRDEGAFADRRETSAVVEVVLSYRCGAAPELHRVSYSPALVREHLARGYV